MTRNLPYDAAQILFALADEGPLTYREGNRSVAHLLECGFVEQTATDKKMMTIMLTERGRMALERTQRGVDPYLKLTE